MRALEWCRKYGVEVIAVILMAGVTILSLVPVSAMPDLHASDKSLHFLAYAAIAGFAFLTPRTSRQSLVLFLAIISLGVVLELAQSQVHRTMEFGDILANTAGVVAGFCVASATLWAWSQRPVKISAGKVSQD